MMARDLARLLRPGHWLKNALIAVPLVYSFHITVDQLICVGLAVIGFCLLSSAIYALNDVFDRDFDRQHPLKKTRPVASRAIQPRQAIWIALILAGIGAGFLLLVGHRVLMVGFIYVSLNIAYTVWLKHLVFLDITLVAAGFGLRVYAGALAASVAVSYWLLLATFWLALFLAFGKRRGSVSRHQAVYQQPYVDRLMPAAAGLGVACYIMAAASVQPDSNLVSLWLAGSTILVLLAVIRCARLLRDGVGDSDPLTILAQDRLILGCGLVWVTSLAWLYISRGLS